MTAAQLRAALGSAGVTASAAGGELTLAGPVPPALLPACRVLKTGLAALSSGRRRYGCDGSTGRVRELAPGALVPAAVTLLAASGADRWDRIPAAARLDRPELFAAPAAGSGGKS